MQQATAVRDLSLEELVQVGGGIVQFVYGWIGGQALSATVGAIYNGARSSTGGNGDMSSWGAP